MVLAETVVTVSDGMFTVLLVAMCMYALLGLWALIDTARRGRFGWTAAVVLLGPLGVGGWVVRRLMDRRADAAQGRRPVGL